MTSASMRGICLQVAARGHFTGIHGRIAHPRGEPVGTFPGAGT
jgi:hypothetical protein